MQTKLPKSMLVISLIFFVLSFSIFVFLYKLINAKNEKLQLSQIQWQTESEKRDEIQDLDRLMAAVEKEKIALDTHFAKSSDVVPFLNTLEGLASSASVEAEISSVDIAKDNTSFFVGIRAAGSFEEIYKFLTLLENPPYELEFALVDMQRPGGQDASKGQIPQWEAIFRVKLLSFLPQVN